jgi:hypothetical protein
LPAPVPAPAVVVPPPSPIKNAVVSVEKPALPADAASKNGATPPAKVNAPAATAANGVLAISSPVSTEIYEGDKHLGSTPLTIELSPGSHELEYRHDDLRKTVTQVIKSGETATANITFEVTVQINARPWAQVFVDGIQRRPLGQTPLSDVRVPIGSVLIFENPNFPGKTYRVTGKDPTIQMIFP